MLIYCVKNVILLRVLLYVHNAPIHSASPCPTLSISDKLTMDWSIPVALAISRIPAVSGQVNVNGYTLLPSCLSPYQPFSVCGHVFNPHRHRSSTEAVLLYPNHSHYKCDALSGRCPLKFREVWQVKSSTASRGIVENKLNQTF